MKMKGFTILELMLVVTILGVLAAVAIPDFVDMVKDNRLTTAANLLQSELTRARSEAGVRGREILVQANPAGWHKGWVVSEVIRHPDLTDEIVPLWARSTELETLQVDITSPETTIRFKPFMQPGTTTNIALCDSRPDETGRRIDVWANGRTYVKRDKDLCA